MGASFSFRACAPHQKINCINKSCFDQAFPGSSHPGVPLSLHINDLFFVNDLHLDNFYVIIREGENQNIILNRACSNIQVSTSRKNQE